MNPRQLMTWAGLIVSLLFVWQPVVADTGRVMTLSGDVKVNDQPMKRSHVVRSGDKITTGANSHVNIVMSDKSVIDIRPNTRFQLENYSFNRRSPKQGNSLMNLLRGTFRYISGLVGRTNHANARIRMGTATAGIRGSYATVSFDGQKAVIDVSLGTLTAVLANGQTITIEKKKAGETVKEKSSTVIVDQGEKGTIVFTAEEAKVEDNPDPDGVMAAAQAILANPSPDAVAAAMQGMSEGEKMMVVAVITANPTQLGASISQVTAAVTAVVKNDPASAPLVGAIATAVAEDSSTSSSIVNSIKQVDGVDKQAIDDASKTSSDDDSSKGGSVGGDTKSPTIKGGSGGTNSPSGPG